MADSACIRDGVQVDFIAIWKMYRWGKLAFLGHGRFGFGAALPVQFGQKFLLAHRSLIA